MNAIRQLIVQTQVERGARAEEKVLLALEERRLNWPEWLKGVRPATMAEDADGVDLVFLTTRGSIGLQIKSSEAGAYEFRKRLRDEIALLVVPPGAKASTIYRGALRYVGQKFDQIHAVDLALAEFLSGSEKSLVSASTDKLTALLHACAAELSRRVLRSEEGSRD